MDVITEFFVAVEVAVMVDVGPVMTFVVVLMTDRSPSQLTGFKTAEQEVGRFPTISRHKCSKAEGTSQQQRDSLSFTHCQLKHRKLPL